MEPPKNNIKTITLNSSQNNSETPSGVTVVKGGIVNAPSSASAQSREFNQFFKEPFNEEERFSETSTLNEGFDNFIGGRRGNRKGTPHHTPQVHVEEDASSVASSSTHSATSEGSVATIELLSEDPLFIVLSQFFMSKESGDNIATILEKINKNLEALIVATKGSQ